MAGDKALEPVDGEATYQGIPCIRAEFTATPGEGANTGSVVIAARSMDAIKISAEGARFTNRPSFGESDTVPRNPVEDVGRAPAPAPNDSVVENVTLKPFGALRLASPQGEITIENLMPVSVEPVKEDDDGLVLYEIQLASVQTIWPHRGAIFGDFNHVDDAGRPIPGQQAATLADLLTRIAGALPGVASITPSTGAAELARTTKPSVSWRFPRPDRELAALLEPHDLHQVLQPNGRDIIVWRRGEGLQQPQDLGIPDPYRYEISYPVMSFVPDSVLVVGAARQREILLELDGAETMVGLAAGEVGFVDAAPPAPAVRATKAGAATNPRAPATTAASAAGAPAGEPPSADDTSEELRPWREALPTYGISESRARRWICLSDEKQAQVMKNLNPGVSAEQAVKLAARLRSWLFRWYRIPATQSTTLPMMDLVDPKTGKEIEPRVWATTFSEVTDVAPAAAGTDRRWGNVGNTPISAAHVEPDRADGVIRFSTPSPPGSLVDVTIASFEQGKLDPPTIRVLYRSELKDGRIRSSQASDPAIPYATAASDFFLFAMERGRRGAAEVAPGNLTTSPRVVHAPELVELEDRRGASNGEALRQRAYEIARAHFEQNPVVKGWDVIGQGIYPVWPDGAVAQVRWRVNEGETVTEVVINNPRRTIDGSAPTYAQKKLVGTVARAQSASERFVDPARTSSGPQARRRR